jgi:dihydrofolate reductase
LRIIIISAIASNNVIGRSNGEMPWYVPEEFKHFKQTTLSSPVLMGRKTFETLGKPLKGRENIIITHNKSFKVDFSDTVVKSDLNEAVDYCRNNDEEKIFIIGGGEIYREAISIVEEMILSYMKFEADGDVYFPEFDIKKWNIISREDREKFEIVHYKKK